MEMIGRGEEGGGGDVNSIINTGFFSTAVFEGFFLY